MGMYSYVDWCDLRIRKGISPEEATKVIEEFNSKWSDNEEEVLVLSDNGSVEVIIDGWKIISYWYKTTCAMFKEMANFIEGTFKLRFETGDEAAILEFEDGLCVIQLGVMKWIEYPLEQFTRELEEERRMRDAKLP